MKSLLIAVFLFVCTGELFSQEKRIDFKKIKSFGESEAYQKLLNRYVTNDTMLTLDDYVNLFYGYASTKMYKPNSSHDSEMVLNKMMQGKMDSVDFKKVAQYATMILHDYPFSIDHVFIQAIAHEKLNHPDSSALYFNKYEKLLGALFASGNGSSEKNAIVVLTIADEYAVLHAMNLRSAGQSLIGDKLKYDMLKIMPNRYNIEKLYFDINYFYGKWEIGK